METVDFDKLTTKFEKVLNGFLQPEFKVTSDVYLEMIITHLTGKNGTDYGVLLKSTTIAGWVDKSINQIDSEAPQSTQVYAFTLRVLSIITQNEWQFMNLFEKNIYTRMKNSLDKNKKLQTPSVKLAHVQVLKALLRYSIGIYWIKQNATWKTVLDYCLENQTVYVVREAQDFLVDFLFKTATDLKDDNLCQEILEHITAPLTETVIIDDGMVCVDSCDLQRKVMPTMKLISHILNKSIRTDVKTSIPLHIMKTFNVEINLWKLTDMTKDEFFFKQIVHVHVYLSYAEFADKLLDNSATSYDYNNFGLKFFNEVKFCIHRQYAMTVLSVAKLYHVLWNALGSRAPEEIELENNKIKFENQIIILQLMPILFVIHKKEKVWGEIMDQYLLKLFDISTDQTMRLCYAFRDLLCKNKNIVPDIASKSVQGILSMMKILHRDRAIYVFQALSYTLRGIVVEHVKDNESIDTNTLIEMPNLLSSILIGLHAMIKEYRITWKESIESLCILNFVLMLLKQPNLSSRLAVQVLKLTQLAIEHFLAPNLALLVDDINGSSLENIGQAIMKRLHDSSWEVRDSAVELLTSMSSIAVFKFPSFRQIIFKNDLCSIVLNMAKHDSEPFVKASALNCLSQMVEIRVFWEQSLATSDLVTHLLGALHTESEGIVRKEAVCLIRQIYVHQKIPNEQLDLLFSTLAHCAVKDLYWEVKTNALNFWRVVLNHQLQHQGVIDGAFPAVTFSKEKKKIVTLTQNEIILRLNKILNELSMRGCLGILLECLNDDCDLEVVKSAVEIIKEITTFLNKYNYMEEILANKKSTHNSKTVPVMDTNYSELSIEYADVIEDGHANESIHSETIIESIISSNDINLLANAYANQLNVDANAAFIDEQYYKTFAHIKSCDFIRKIMSMDLDTMFKNRSDWIMNNESFDSLLDDMMFSLQINDINSADCY